MKKKYITPTTQAYAFCTENMLALSGGKVDTFESDPNGTTNASDALSNKADLTHQGIWANMND